MGNLVLQIKLIKNCLIYQWQFTLLSIVTVCTCVIILKTIRSYSFLLDESISIVLRLAYLTIQILVVVIFTKFTLEIARRKVAKNASEFKAFVIIGLNKSEILLCLIINSFIISAIGFFFGTSIIAQYQLATYHFVPHSVFEAMSIIMGGTIISVFAASITIKECIDNRR